MLNGELNREVRFAIAPMPQSSFPQSANPWQFIEIALAERDRHHRRRQLPCFTPIDSIYVRQCCNGGDSSPSGEVPRLLLNFSANDYLGLAKHPQVIAQAVDYTQRYGTGATASRLVAGGFDIHRQLEEQLAQALGKEAVLLFGTGFQANATVLPTLLDGDALVLCDRLIHNSLIQGIRASQARFMRYPHNDLDALERQLKTAQTKSYSRVMIVSETVFSMDGDRADVSALVALGDRYGALLYLDDAHGFGVLGPQGMGLAAQQEGIDIVVGTFGKACGSSGAFVACSIAVRDYLINFCPGVIYTTALPPGVVGAAMAALALFPQLGAERAHLQGEAEWLRSQLKSLGYNTAGSASQIVPAIVGAEEATLALSVQLEAAGILATAIRPPTVASGTSRLRFALSSQHQRSHVEQLVAALQGTHLACRFVF